MTNEFDDEFDEDDEAFAIEHIDYEQAQEIIDWAMQASSLVILMRNTPDHDTAEQGLVRLEHFLDGIEMMFEAMPGHLLKDAEDIAAMSEQYVADEEELVEKFKKELDEQLP